MEIITGEVIVLRRFPHCLRGLFIRYCLRFPVMLGSWQVKLPAVLSIIGPVPQADVEGLRSASTAGQLDRFRDRGILTHLYQADLDPLEDTIFGIVNFDVINRLLGQIVDFDRDVIAVPGYRKPSRSCGGCRARRTAARTAASAGGYTQVLTDVQGIGILQIVGSRKCQYGDAVLVCDRT